MWRYWGLWCAAVLGASSASPWIPSAAASLILASVSVFLACICDSQAVERRALSRPEAVTGIVFAFAVAVWFRLQYLDTVPAGYLYEVLNFVHFAQYLKEHGFPYEPYAWYAHTLFSYAIAVVNLLVPDNLAALRWAQFWISLLTVGAIGWCAWSLLGPTTAWITTALVATSWWHVWATRNGYHQFLTPLFQALVLVGLIQGLRKGSPRYLAVAIVGVAGGLHAYWALYLMPPFAMLVIALYIWQYPDHWPRVRGNVGVATMAATLLSLPAVWAAIIAPEGFSYVFRGLDPVRVGAASIGEKLAANASFLISAFFPPLGATDRPPAVVDYLVRGSCLIGLGVAIRRAPSHLSTAAILLLLAINLVGLLGAITNEFYIIAIFLPLFLLAGLGCTTLIETAASFSRGLRYLLIGGFALAWAYFGYGSVQRFFGVWAYRMFRSPDHPQGVAFLLLPHWRQCAQGGTCMVPGKEPGRDFEEEALSLGTRLPNYAWLHALGRVNSAHIAFPPVEVAEAKPLRLVLPAAPHIERRLQPAWMELYPTAKVSTIQAPPPWNKNGPVKLARLIEIPWEAIEKRYLGTLGPGIRKALLWIPEAGPYEFRPLLPWSTTSGFLVEKLLSEGTVYLEPGYHLLVVPVSTWGWTGWQIRRFGLGWDALDRYVVAVTDVEIERLIKPYLGRSARMVDKEWVLHATISLPGPIWDMAFCPGHSVAAIIDGRLYRIQVETHEVAELGVVDLPDPFVRCTAEGIDLVGRDGRWLRFQGRLHEQPPLPCGVRAMTKNNDRMAALCGNSQIWQLDGPVLYMVDRFGQPLVQPVAIEFCNGLYHVLDAAFGEWLTYSPDGALVESKPMPHIWWDSELTCDAEQTLYVLEWATGRPAFSADRHLLFHPVFRRPALFVRGAEWFHGFGFRKFIVSQDLGAWTRDRTLEILQRLQPASVPRLDG
ncbi:MAG: hypothetical protein KatS3mg077_0255 [Candidatus Binatia bacterium]|nr:MAG: hypothetical protein KatS3mg077_0255 [Candidatus Binatia bacterium]